MEIRDKLLFTWWALTEPVIIFFIYLILVPISFLISVLFKKQHKQHRMLHDRYGEPIPFDQFDSVQDFADWGVGKYG